MISSIPLLPSVDAPSVCLKPTASKSLVRLPFVEITLIVLKSDVPLTVPNLASFARFSEILPNAGLVPLIFAFIPVAFSKPSTPKV